MNTAQKLIASWLPPRVTIDPVKRLCKWDKEVITTPSNAGVKNRKRLHARRYLGAVTVKNPEKYLNASARKNT